MVAYGKVEAIKDLAKVTESDDPTQQHLMRTGAMRYLSKMILGNPTNPVGRDIVGRIITDIVHIAQNPDNCQEPY